MSVTVPKRPAENSSASHSTDRFQNSTQVFLFLGQWSEFDFPSRSSLLLWVSNPLVSYKWMGHRSVGGKWLMDDVQGIEWLTFATCRPKQAFTTLLLPTPLPPIINRRGPQILDATNQKFLVWGTQYWMDAQHVRQMQTACFQEKSKGQRFLEYLGILWNSTPNKNWRVESSTAKFLLQLRNKPPAQTAQPGF